MTSVAAGQIAPKTDCVFVFERTPASLKNCATQGPAAADHTNAPLRPPTAQAYAAECYESNQSTCCQPRWQLLIKRKDPLQPGPDVELSQDGLSLPDWRPRWDCEPQMRLTAPHHLTHVKVNMLAGDATKLDKVSKHVEGTCSPAGGRARTRYAWAPYLSGLPSGIYACCEATCT